MAEPDPAPAADVPPPQASPGSPLPSPPGPSPASSGVDVRDPRVRALIDRYWRTNLTIMAVLLVIWAIVGLGCGVLWADFLNHWHLPGTGYPLGFWFAQQGSIVVFVVLILIYAVVLNHLDKRHHETLAKLRKRDAEGQR
ncbi:MAG: DUF4212 domain-containing protein [Phycisphaeraceae bacterium]